MNQTDRSSFKTPREKEMLKMQATLQQTSVNRLSPSRNLDSISHQYSSRRNKSLMEIDKRPSKYNQTEATLKESILGASQRRRQHQTISNINDDKVDRLPFNLDRLEDFEDKPNFAAGDLHNKVGAQTTSSLKASGISMISSRRHSEIRQNNNARDSAFHRKFSLPSEANSKIQNLDNDHVFRVPPRGQPFLGQNLRRNFGVNPEEQKKLEMDIIQKAAKRANA